MERICTILILGIFFSITTMAQDACQAVGFATCNSLTAANEPPTGGGSATPVTVTDWATFLSLAQKKTAPRVIYVKGTLGYGYGGDTGKVVVASNTTIIGLPGAVIKGSFQLKRVSNVIIRNIKIEGPGSDTKQGLDNMCIDGSTKVWIDHCQFTDGGDGNLDIVKGSDNVSVTWCLFTYPADGIHNLSNLIGGADDEYESIGMLNVTYQYCWWKDCADRQPRTRFGHIHVANCYSSMRSGMTSSNGAAAGHDVRLRIENCVYENLNNPIKTMTDVDSCYLEPINNQFINCTGSQISAPVSYGGYTGFTPPYSLQIAPVANVKSLVMCGAGASMLSPTQCGCSVISLPLLTISSGMANQTVSTGTAITSIVYTWGGSATDVTVTGLPAGLTATKNTSAKTVTIAGTPTATGTFTVTTVQPSGTAAALTGTITVSSILASVQLHLGWNYIGCPLSGSSDVAKALSSIWSHVLVVKNYDSFYDKSVSSSLNSLTKVDWGKGYMVKIDADCTLDWVVR